MGAIVLGDYHCSAGMLIDFVGNPNAMGGCTQSWFCEWETHIVTQTGLQTITDLQEDGEEWCHLIGC